MPSLRTRALSLGVAAAAFGAFGVIASTASASTNVIVEVQIQARIFKKDPAIKDLSHVNPKTKAQVEALIPRYRHLEKRFRTAANAIAGSSANTAGQRLGRTEWVTGARTFANGLNEFDAGLEQLLHGKPSQAKTTISNGDKKLQAGDKLIAKGNHTLGLR
jgi:hypothetical protein